MKAETLAALKAGVLLQPDDLRILIALTLRDPLTASKLCELLGLRYADINQRTSKLDSLHLIPQAPIFCPKTSCDLAGRSPRLQGLSSRCTRSRALSTSEMLDTEPHETALQMYYPYIGDYVMSAKLFQMGPPMPAKQNFHRKVETAEANVNFDIRSIVNEDGTCPLCVVDLPNSGPQGGLCRALLKHENVDQLIAALNVWKVLR